MKLGSYDVPYFRLVPNIMEILEQIYETKHRAKMQSKEMALLLGYKYGTEPHFYKRLSSLVGYGVIEGKGTYSVSELGEKLLHSRTEQEKNLAKTKAVLNVRLWKEIYSKHGKNPREDNFWAVLMDITKVNPDQSKNIQSKIFKWYSDDISHISDDLVKMEFGKVQQEETKHLSSTNTQSNQMSQQMAPSSDTQIISFDKYQISLPKGDLTKEWKKLKKYMEVKLEDYKYEEPKSAHTSDSEEASNNEPDN